jgi:hypothetical protein
MKQGGEPMVREDVIEKLQKLKAHADSAEDIGNEEEAQAFAAMFQRLLLKHKLNMTDIEMQRHETEEPVEERYIDFGDEVQRKQHRIGWQAILADVVARAYFCRILCMSRSNRLILVGRKSDSEIAEYVIVTLLAAAIRLSKSAKHEYVKKTYGRARGSFPELKGFRTSWLNGFVSRLRERLDEELNQEVASSNSSTALMRINRASDAVDKYMYRYGTKSWAIRQSRHNASGYNEGRRAADKVDIRGRAMNGDREPKQLR